MALDLSEYSERMSIPYTQSEAVVLTSTDHTPELGFFRGLLITASGNVKIDMKDGGTIVLPVVVTASDFVELRGYFISKVYKTGTTATVPYGLY